MSWTPASRDVDVSFSDLETSEIATAAGGLARSLSTSAEIQAIIEPGGDSVRRRAFFIPDRTLSHA